MARKFVSANSTAANSASTLYTPTAALSVSFWMSVTASPASDTTVLSFTTNSSSPPYILFPLNSSGFAGNFAMFSAMPGINCNIDFGIGTPSLNTWHHVAVTGNGNGSTCVAYFDGVQKATAVGGAGSSGSFAVNIGLDGRFGRWVDANIADVAFWNTQLTQTEVTALSKGARPYMIRPALMLG